MIIGYARVSTEDQDLQLQMDALEKFGCERIVTEKASGKTMDRTKFQAFIKHGVRRGDVLVVWKLDRLGRTLSGVVQVIEELQVNGIDLVSITDGFDVRTPMGKAMMQITLVFAELERNLISERTKAGMAAAKAGGATFGRQHYIRDFPKRIRKLNKMNADGELLSADRVLLVSPRDLMDILNKADKEAPQIINPETIRRWARDNFPWLDEKETN